MIGLSNEEISKILRGIYDGSITDEELPSPIYVAIADVLKKGVYEGYGIDFTTLQKQITAGTNTTFTKGDFELLGEFRDNVYMFSAAKTYQQVKQMSDAAIGDDGFLKPYNEFKKDARQIFDTFNEDYLKTEYNTCVGQATMGAQWNRIQATKDALPFLRFKAIGHACPICSKLDGLTARVDDPVWRKLAPLIHFNCFCILEQLREDEAAITPDEQKEAAYNHAMEHMQDNFKMNAGIDKVVFKADHPYFTAPKELKKNNFGLPIPDED